MLGGRFGSRLRPGRRVERWVRRWVAREIERQVTRWAERGVCRSNHRKDVMRKALNNVSASRWLTLQSLLAPYHPACLFAYKASFSLPSFIPQPVRPEFEMRNPKNAALYSAEASSTSSGFKNMHQMSKVVETTGSSLGTGKQVMCAMFVSLNAQYWQCSISHRLQKRFRVSPSRESLRHHDQYGPPYCRTQACWVWWTRCCNTMSWLALKEIQNFKSVVDYDQSDPAEEDIRIHGIWEVKKRAQINTFNNAAEASCNGWGYEPAECYRRVIRIAGLGKELARAILN